MAQDNWKIETNQTECQKRDNPFLCTNNCGFFGSTVTNNLCSKCYRHLVMKQQLEAAAIAPAVGKSPSMASSSSVIVEPIREEELVSLDETRVDNINKNQSEEQRSKKPACELCRKMLGLTGFKCRCGGTYCSNHRYSENHECSFDYKSTGREAIAKANPVVKAEKIEKI